MKLRSFPPVHITLLAMIAFLASACSEKSAERKTETSSAQNSAPLATITPEAAKAAGIETAISGPSPIRETLTVYGSIRPNAEREQILRPRYPGIVKSVGKHPGDTVKQGETLLTIESNESLRSYAIVSPLDGQVLDRRVNPGEAVSDDTVLLRVADLSNVWADFAIFARDLDRVRADLVVTITAREGGPQTEARIAYVAPAGDKDSQSVIARAVVDNSDRRWVSGQFVTAEIVLSETQAAVSVAPEALQTLEGETVVFLQSDQGFEARPVSIGKRSAEAVEITKGLKGGERYASANSYVIKADLTKGEAEEN